MHDIELLTCLQADSLMFHHIYADLVFLAKSRDLHKSIYDMRQHYLELKMFLAELQKHPEIIINRHLEVFVSEPRLYSNGKLNHRYHTHSCTPDDCVQESLFHNLHVQSTSLFSNITEGAKQMSEKLCSYAVDYLPGGIYWDPGPEISQILEPSNDLCESNLGLNDYLTTSLPNLHQLSKSNLVEVIKNGTMKWFADLPPDRQKFIIELAQRNRKYVKEFSKEQEQQLIKKRQENMLQEKRKKQVQKVKQMTEKDELSKLHLIETVCEFDDTLAIKEEE